MIIVKCCETVLHGVQHYINKQYYYYSSFCLVHGPRIFFLLLVYPSCHFCFLFFYQVCLNCYTRSHPPPCNSISQFLSFVKKNVIKKSNKNPCAPYYFFKLSVACHFVKKKIVIVHFVNNPCVSL